MSAQEMLARIRPAWLHHVSHSLARKSGVRKDFQHQLEKLFALLEQAVESGDPACLDAVLVDWGNVPTQTDLGEGKHYLSTLLSKIVVLTYEVIRETLEADESLDLIASIAPALNYALQKMARFEMETQIGFVSNELYTVQQKLDRLDKSKSNFIAVAAHELKTPLTLIEGYTSMIGELTPKELDGIHTLLQGVHNGIRRLREIIDDLIDVSMIDNNLLELNLQPAWPNRILNLLAAELEGSLSERNQRLEIRSFPGSGELIFVDPERIYQALKNIVMNAIKYTPDGGPITIDGRLLPGFLEITVTDTGIGISTENQEIIFEKFGQLGSASLHSSGKTKFKGGGPGLGLPIAKGIITAHGGSIWVESGGCDEASCPGSTFHILLPIRTQPNDPNLAKLFGVGSQEENNDVLKQLDETNEADSDTV
jgi:signal transduction histidine kinase